MTVKQKPITYKGFIWKFLLISGFLIYSGWLMLQSPNSPLSNVPEYVDSGVFQYIGRKILEGYMPYRDIFDHKGPLLYLLNALGLQLMGRHGIWLMEWIFLSTTLIVSYKLCRVFFSRCASVLSVFMTFSLLGLYLEGGNFTEEYAMLPCVIALYIFAKYFKEKDINNLELFLLGAGLMSTLLLKANVACAWVIFCVYFAVISLWKKQFKELLRYVILFLLGSCTFFLPIGLWLFIKGAWTDFIKSYIEFNLIYTSANGSPAILQAAKFYLSDNNLQIMLLLGILTPVFVYHKEKDRDTSVFVLLNTVYLLCTFVLMIMPGNQFTHYGLYYMPGMLIVFAVTFYYLEKLIRSDNSSAACLAFCILIFLVKSIWISNMLEQISEISLTWQVSEEKTELIEAVQRLTDPEDKIIMIGNECWVYNHTGRDAANKYIFQSPLTWISPEIARDYEQLILENPPELVIIQGSKKDDKTIIQQYSCELAEVHGSYRLYKKSSEN